MTYRVCDPMKTKVIQILRTREHNPLLLHYIVHLHLEPGVHLEINDQPRRVKRITEDLIEGKIPGSRLRLIRQEDYYRFRFPLFKLNLSRPRPHPLDVARECIR